MAGIPLQRQDELREEFRKVLGILETAPTIDKHYGISREEFLKRQRSVSGVLEEMELSVGFVFSDEHYCGDVPYLGGNTNISIEEL